nr:hypothetical protein [uncultured Roseobacter sp.]
MRFDDKFGAEIGQPDLVPPAFKNGRAQFDLKFLDLIGECGLADGNNLRRPREVPMFSDGDHI